MSRLTLENIPRDTEASQYENQIHETLLVKNKCDISKAMQAEPDQRKKESDYKKNIDEGKDCTSLLCVLKEKVGHGEKLIKARLSTRGFEENRWGLK